MTDVTEATEAPALVVLRRTLDVRWPRRSRVADRILGRDGDHARGDAIDVSYDPVGGPDLERLAGALLRDPRTAAIMWRGRIAEPCIDGGAWRPDARGAEGGNAGHLHLSVDPQRRAWVGPWQLEGAGGATGDVFSSLDAERTRALRSAPREFLRTTWVRHTPIGRFLQLDAPDDAATVPIDTGGQLEQGGAEAAKGAAIGGTVGSALEAVPVFGPVLHAASVVIGAIGGFFAGLGRDTFHPDATVAAAWLALFNLNPAMLYSNVDTVDVGKGEQRAARLVRYFLLVSGTVPPAGELYNPNSDRTDNPYMQKVDPRFPQTNPLHDARIKLAVMAHKPTPPEVNTPLAARGLLALIRKVLAPSGIMKWDEPKAHLTELRHNLQHVRALAGEHGHDPNLETLFGGDVTPVVFYPLARGVHLGPHLVARPARRLGRASVRGRETGDTGTPTSPVIIYGASWCRARTVDYLRERRIPFVTKDIEHTIGAKAEMEDKLARAGIKVHVLPVIDVAGRILVGLNPAELDDALRVAGYAVTPPVERRSRLHAVTHLEASTAGYRGTYDAMELIARDWDALDRDWLFELMRANPDKARDEQGYWKALGEGEMLWIPAAWPEPPPGPRKMIVIPPEAGRVDDPPQSREQGGWTMVDPSWLPGAARIGIPIDRGNVAQVRARHPKELASVTDAELFKTVWVLMPWSSVFDGASYAGYSRDPNAMFSNLARFYDPARPWRGASMGVFGVDNDADELPLITPTNRNRGKVVGRPFDPSDWSKGVALGGNIVDAEGNVAPYPGWNSSETQYMQAETGRVDDWDSFPTPGFPAAALGEAGAPDGNARRPLSPEQLAQRLDWLRSVTD